jgi:serine/threonine protein kinase/WD40 repeat protein
MTQQDSKGREAGRDKKAYGTQYSAFRSDSAPSNDDSGSVQETPGVARQSGGGAGPFGTRMAQPIHELSAGQPQEIRVLPSRAQFREVSQTQKAEGSQVSLLTQIAGTQLATVPSVSRPDSSTNSLKSTVVPQASPEGVNPKIGRSTWNLRIHRRDVAGQISGIVNPVPSDGEGATGLQSAFSVGDDAPEYEIQGQLGAGSMGIVYRAVQLSLNRELAIKTLKPVSTHADHDQAMFVSEAVVTANLVHPNIIPIHDLGRTSDGKLFYSMKKVTGVPWNDVLRTTSLEDNLDIFMKLCDAVAYAHSRGVINRDLKPENVVVGEYGEVVVLDWGLAITTDRFEKRKSVLVDFRGGAGTPVYMAPELLDAGIESVGPFSDIYLLGAILFEVVEGYPPHLLKRLWELTDPQDQLDGVIRAVINNEIEEDVVCPGELMQIARRAMATLPKDRFTCVEDLQDAIREYRITGRAEELMNSVDGKTVSDYTEYQSAVALYSEALRKWPDNRRAIEGDKKARLAYAKLAHHKGDIDLGLQVVARQSDESFRPVVKGLKKTRLIRKIVRGTWGVTTVAAVLMVIVSTFLRIQAEIATAEAVQARTELESANGQLDEVKGKVEQEQRKAEAQTKLAELETQRASEAQDKAMKALQAAEIAEKETKEQKRRGDELAIEAMKQEVLAKEYAKLAEMKSEEAKLAELEKQKITVQLETEKKEADAARTAKYQSQMEGFISKIDAAQELGEYGKVIVIAQDALKLAETNPLLKLKSSTLQGKIDDAIRKGGNAEIPLQLKPDSAAISSDGSTVVAFSGGKTKMLTVMRSEGGLHFAQPVPVTIPTTIKGNASVSVSNNGRSFCLISKTERQLWQLQDDRYVQIPLGLKGEEKPSGDVNFAWSFYSPNDHHLYLIGDDESATVEIYSVETGSLLVSQPLAGKASRNFEIKDVVLLPDESALIVQFKLNECYEYRITWTRGVPAFVQQLANTAPRMKAIEVADAQLTSRKPERLFISPDGQRLALAFSETIVVLQRTENVGAGEFSFSVPQKTETTPTFRCSFATLTDLGFSQDEQGNQRIVTAHGNRYLQLWDRSGATYAPCAASGLYVHRPTKSLLDSGFAACLRGHSDVIKAVKFVNGNADRLISVSADRSIRTWEISTYPDLVTRIKDVCRVFEPTGTPEAPTAGIQNRDSEGKVNDHERTASASQKVSRLLEFARPTFTGVPASGAQPALPNLKRFRGGQGIFSAKFSPDSRRLLIGANDLAAHVFDSQNGERVLTASMAGRRDLFFDPDRNNFLEGHISEIACVQFMPPVGDLLLTGDYFGSISVWDSLPDENGVGYEKSRLLSEYSFSEFAVSADGTLVLAGGATSTNPSGALKDADLNHMGVVWKTADILQSPNPAPSMILEGEHKDFAITAVGISPTAEKLITAGRRGRIVVWNAVDGAVLARIPGSHNRDQIVGLFFESESQFVTAGYDGKIFRWTISDNEVQPKEIVRTETEAAPEFIVRLRPSPDRQRFATSEVSVIREANGERAGRLNIMIWSQDGTRALLSRAIEVPNNDKEIAFRHDVSWSSTGTELMLVQDGNITIYETTNWKIIRKFRLDAKDARPVRGAIAPSADGNSLRAATFDGRFTQLWDLKTGEHLAEFRSHAKYSIVASFSADQKFVATASETLRIFDSAEGSPNRGATVYRLPVRSPHISPLADVEFSPTTNQSLATIDNRGTIEIWKWDPAQERPLSPLYDAVTVTQVRPEWAEDRKFGNDIAWRNDGNSIIVLQDGVLASLKLGEGNLTRVEYPMPAGIECRFNQLDISADGKLLTAGGVAWNAADEELLSYAAVWDIEGETPRLIATINNQHSVDSVSESGFTGITAIAFDDRRNAIVTGGADTRLIRWNLAGVDSESVATLDRIADMLEEGTRNAHRVAVTAIDIAPDGRTVTADQQGVFILWENW